MIVISLSNLTHVRCGALTCVTDPLARRFLLWCTKLPVVTVDYGHSLVIMRTNKVFRLSLMIGRRFQSTKNTGYLVKLINLIISAHFFQEIKPITRELISRKSLLNGAAKPVNTVRCAMMASLHIILSCESCIFSPLFVGLIQLIICVLASDRN